jgi:hypothetical protein
MEEIAYYDFMKLLDKKNNLIDNLKSLVMNKIEKMKKKTFEN